MWLCVHMGAAAAALSAASLASAAFAGGGIVTASAVARSRCRGVRRRSRVRALCFVCAARVCHECIPGGWYESRSGSHTATAVACVSGVCDFSRPLTGIINHQ